ncbi:MAG TPA: sigma-54 dependent transcriptional regulator [Candidatus Eisenbacteria bacterium]|nr:sigma-54 dependent transcriptional regulator [Candidatus Eisenbacteria bacterium]
MARRERGTTDQARTIRRLKKRLYELKSLLEVTRDLTSAPDEESVLKLFLRSCISMVQAESAAVFRYEPVTGRLRLVDERNLPDPKKRPTAVLSADEVGFLEGPEAREGVVLRASLVPQARDFAREQGTWLAAWETEALVPLVARGGLWGVAVFGPRLLNRAYGPTAVGLLIAAAQTAATTLETVSRGTGARATVPEVPRAAAAPRVTPAPDPVTAPHPALLGIVGESAALKNSLLEMSRVAPTRFPVLILGPTGTGKELAAHAIHRISPRAEGPFEVVDCGSIPRELIESELFGHVKGAFTGATRDRRGAFELAHGGTLFLDEVGELPAMAQTRLLRILQEGQLRRVGDERQVHVNVRVVAATNRELLEEVAAGRFRSDLYYRLSVFTVRMPSLSERKGDLPMLVEHLLNRLSVETDHPKPRLSQGVMRRLSEYPFPGNIRELQNVLAALMIRHGGGEPRPEDLDGLLGGSSAAASARADEDLYEDELPSRGDAESVGRWVLEQLRKCDFNVSQAERALDRLQRSAAGKAAAPVADRSSLTYYLQGECFRAFAESGFDLGTASRAIAKMPDLESQARARLERFLGFIAEVASGSADEAAAQRACRERLPKLPALYTPYLDAVAGAYVRGKWAPQS